MALPPIFFSLTRSLLPNSRTSEAIKNMNLIIFPNSLTGSSTATVCWARRVFIQHSQVDLSLARINE